MLHSNWYVFTFVNFIYDNYIRIILSLEGFDLICYENMLLRHIWKKNQCIRNKEFIKLYLSKVLFCTENKVLFVFASL